MPGLAAMGPIIRWAQFPLGEIKRSVCQPITARRADAVFTKVIFAAEPFGLVDTAVSRGLRRQRLLSCSEGAVYGGIVVERSTDGAKCSWISMQARSLRILEWRLTCC